MAIPSARLTPECEAGETGGFRNLFIAGRIAASLNVQLYPKEGAAAVGVIGRRCGGVGRMSADVAYVKLTRLPWGAIPEGELPVPPDLVVLLFSAVNSKRDVFGEVDDHLAQGVSLVWTVNPVSKRIRVYRQNGTTRSFHAGEAIENEPRLPGFRLFVGDAFPADVSDIVPRPKI